MSLPVGAFSAQVQLPCSVFCGPDFSLRVCGLAVSIDTRNLVLLVPAVSEYTNVPQPGERVRLELSLPVSDTSAGAKYLALRACVEGVVETDDGARQIRFTFRKVSFKDRGNEAPPKSKKLAGKAWRM
jgi:hypothetical protein